MENRKLIEKTHRYLRNIHYANFVLLLVIFIMFSLLKPRQPVAGYVYFQQVMIIFAIIAIPAALKLFSSQLKKIMLTGNLEKYKKIYHIRLGILDLIFIINIAGLYATGIMNFSFMAIITIFALFFCLPSIEQMEMVMDLRGPEPETEEDESETEQK